jgi:hypothetical protein
VNNGVNNGVETGGNGVNNGVAVDPVAEFSSACGRAPEGAVVRIARVVNGQRSYLPETMEPSEFSPEWLGERCGGGRFFVSLVAPGAAGYLKGCSVQVQGMGAAGGMGAAAAAVPPAAPSGGFDASALMSAALAMMQTAMAQQTQVVTAILSRPGDGLKLADLLPIIQGGGGGGGLGEAVSALKALRELSGDMGGDGGGGDGGSADPLAGLAAAVLPSLLAAQRAPSAAAAAPVKQRPRITREGALKLAATLEERARRARDFAARGLGQRLDVRAAESAAKSAAAAAHVAQRGGDGDGVDGPAVLAKIGASISPFCPGWMARNVYREVRVEVGELLRSIGGAPDWLSGGIVFAMRQRYSAQKLAHDVVIGAAQAGVSVPSLSEPQWSAVLDLLTENDPVVSGAARVAWIESVADQSWGIIFAGDDPDEEGGVDHGGDEEGGVDDGGDEEGGVDDGGDEDGGAEVSL